VEARGIEGPEKKSTDPPVHLLNPRPTHPPSDFLFKYVFGRFSASGVPKQPQYFCKKSMSKLFQQKTTKFRCQFFLNFFFVLSRLRVFLQWEFKNTKKGFETNIVSKVERFLQNIRPKIQNRFFLDFVFHVFGCFSAREVQKHNKENIGKTNLTPSLFRTLTHPPTTVVTDIFFEVFRSDFRKYLYGVFGNLMQRNDQRRDKKN
jgi:hypothetical protein